MTNVYDAMGNHVGEINQLGNRETYLYDSYRQRKAEINALGNRTTYVRDILGQITALVDPLSNRLSYAYDKDGLRRREMNQLGKITTTGPTARWPRSIRSGLA